jgi:hypothetical protein
MMKMMWWKYSRSLTTIVGKEEFKIFGPFLINVVSD